MTTVSSSLGNDGDVQRIQIDVIIPVHNASSTIEEAVLSAMRQTVSLHLKPRLQGYALSIHVCCYDDGSTDDSWSILQKLRDQAQNERVDDSSRISSSLFIQKSSNDIARGAGFARNRAVELSSHFNKDWQFLCLLDSDDTMHPHRVAEQVCYMLMLAPEDRIRTLLGCNFDRDPPDSTWHYSQWANALDDERLLLERFREVTILQPTWFLSRQRFLELGGYVEAPPRESSESELALFFGREQATLNRLVHPLHDNLESLRLAEDLRFFHDHLDHDGTVRLHRTKTPLVTYRHTGTSQSFRTSRKLLLQLRVLAFERSVIRLHHSWQNDDGRMVVWGAGRDGKDFLKALSEDIRSRIYCFVDVAETKLDAGRYVNRDLKADIPILHFLFLVKDETRRRKILADWETGDTCDESLGRINKGKPKAASHGDEGCTVEQPPAKKRKAPKRTPLQSHGLDLAMLQRLPVVVCVAMYRTGGALERNVQAIGRKEGIDLWHFS